MNMMKRQECVVLLLADVEGKRLGVLTTTIAKIAVHFGGEYRIIHNHIGNSSDWGLDHKDKGISLLPSKENNLYSGTSDAVFQNMAYLEQFEPSYVLIISGDNIYNLDYQKMLEHHKQTNADVTISVVPVSWGE
jgi:glucose-1-phosphate adenylyltransferase